MNGQWVWSASKETKGKGASKGTGKNKGKSSGKGRSVEMKDGDWICHEVGCALEAFNFAWRTNCMGCGCKHRTKAELARAKAAHVKEAAKAVDEDGFEIKLNRKQRRKAAKERKEQE